jgi:phosphoserine phosphatase
MMKNYQLLEPVDAIIFDCDGTLSHIEGIDELATARQVGAIVKKLTAEAMGRGGINPALYAERLNLVLPTRTQVDKLGEQYFQQKTPDLMLVLDILKRLKKQIYIVSAGLMPAVTKFAGFLKINPENIFAVPIYFDEMGNYLDFDHQSPLVRELGKRVIVQQIKEKYPRCVYVGDGLNDLETYDLVTRFVGYGGAYYRKNIEEQCEFYITDPSMAPLLPVCLTKHELSSLTLEESLQCGFS